MKSALMFIFLVFASCLYGAELTVRPDKLETVVAGSCIFSVEIKMSGSEILTDIEIDADKTFQLSMPSVSTSTIIVNGQKSSIHVYAYSIYPISGGTYTISVKAVVYDGKTTRNITGTLPVFVKGDSVPLYSYDRTSSGIPVLTAINPIKMAMTVSDPEPYVNEQLVAELSIYSKFKLLKYPDFIYYPSFNGFWTETGDSYFTASQIQTEFGTVFKYSVKWILFPVQAGTATVGGAGTEIVISSYPLLPRKLNLYSDSIILYVKTLPNTCVPASFKGSVGRYLISMETPRSIDSTAEISVIVSGTGNIKGIEEIEIPDIKGADIYFASSEIEIESREPYLTGRKIYRWTIIPCSAGEIIIPPLQFSYFDPDLSSYVTSQTPVCTLGVTRCASSSPVPAPTDTLPLNSEISVLKFPDLPDKVLFAAFVFSASVFTLGTARYLAKNSRIFKRKRNRSNRYKTYLKNAIKYARAEDYDKSFDYLKKSLQSFFSEEESEKMSLKEISEAVLEMTGDRSCEKIFAGLEEIDFTEKKAEKSIIYDIKAVERLYKRIEKAGNSISRQL